jgi:AsmA protein
VRLAVSGTTSIPEREFNLSGTANLISATASDANPLLELPFAVRGQWGNPSIVPDTRTLLERSPTVRSLLDAQDKKTRDEIQDAIKRLTKSPLGAPR